MKLKFMEQILSQHLRVAKTPRVVFENEEVEKSQVILAAQDMVDSIQKYYEDVNDMLVKELPALVDSIQSEIGANESESYNQQAGETLTALNTALQEAKTAMTAALGGLTGQGGMDAFGAAPEMDGEDDLVGMDDMGDMSDEFSPLPPPEEEEVRGPEDRGGRQGVAARAHARTLH
jgi:hypothetical protein